MSEPRYSFSVERLKLLMGDLNQPEFAALVNIKQSMVSKYLDGESQPSLKVLIKIATRTGTSIDWLVGLSDDPRLRIGNASDDETLLILAYKSNNLEKLFDLISKHRKQVRGGDSSPS